MKERAELNELIRLNQLNEESAEPVDPGRSARIGVETGFTLIELLVVVGIIAILAAMIIPAGQAAKAAQMRSKAKGQLSQIDSMIQSYKARKNFYPPSAPNSGLTNTLYYELSGTVLDTNRYTTLDGNAQIDASLIQPIFGVGGFVNVTQGSGSDEATGAQNFTKGTLAPSQVVEVKNRIGKPFMVLSTSIEGPPCDLTPRQQGVTVNPFGYNSANPTNNPKSYDLWVDIIVRGKTNRVCNWSDKPIVLQ